MSINLPQVDVSTSGAFKLNTLGVQLEQTGWIEFINESPWTLTVQIGGMHFQVPAWYDYPKQVQSNQSGVWQPVGGAQFPVSILPTLLPSPGVALSTTLLITLYMTGEQPAITTPQPLVRQAFIPNTVSTSQVGTATALVSDGAVPVNADVINVFGPGQSTYGTFEVKPNGQVNMTVANVDLAGVSSFFASFPDPGTNNNTNTILQLGTSGYVTNIFGLLAAQNAIEIFPPAIVLNGSTSGTATLYMSLRGTWKHVIVLLSNFRNGSAGNQTIALPTAFTNSERFYYGAGGQLQLLSSGVAQTLGIITTLAAGGGTVALQTTLNRYSIGDNGTPIDTISFLGSQGSADTGIFVLEGI